MSERYVIREGCERGKGRYWADDGGVRRWVEKQGAAKVFSALLCPDDHLSIMSPAAIVYRIVRLVPKRSEPDERDRLLDAARELLHKLKPDIHIHAVERWLAAHDKLRGAK